MAVKKEKALTVQDQALVVELTAKMDEAAALVPEADVKAYQAAADLCQISNDTEFQAAVNSVGVLAGHKGRLEKFWEETKQYHWTRYKLVNLALAAGIPSFGVVGTDTLDAIRAKFDAAMKRYSRSRQAAVVNRQAAITEVSEASKAETRKRIEEMADDGDMAGARELRRTLAETQEVLVIARPLEAAGVSMSEPCKWSIEEDGGMAKLVAAVAAGEIALWQNVVVRGVAEKRCIFDIHPPVMNQRVREMGENLHYPGIVVEKDMAFAVDKR